MMANCSGVEYLLDAEVDQSTDHEIRALLTRCFPSEEVFKARRFCSEVPKHRFLVRSVETRQKIVGHVAVHEKSIFVSGREIVVGGVAEVAVCPDFRGQGVVRKLLREAHNFLSERDFLHAVLFGNPSIYRSSGYQVITDPIKFRDKTSDEWRTEVLSGAMVCPLKENLWPRGMVDLRGPLF